MTEIPISYRGNGDWGTGEGADLTAEQIDQNFYELVQAINNISQTPGVSISSITSTSSTLTFHLSDGTTQGPFTLPVAAMTYRGNWAASTTYAKYNLALVSGDGLYLILVGHISAATFDAGRTIGGQEVYTLLLPVVQGPAGEDGLSFNVDESGTLAGRSAYDGEAEGFRYLSTDGDGATYSTAVIFIRSGSAGWSDPIPVQGPQGEKGDTGDTGATGAAGADGEDGQSFEVNAVGYYADRGLYDGEAAGFNFLSINGDAGATTSLSVIYQRQGSAGWSDAIGFQGPKGDTGAAGAAGATGATGAKGDTGDTGPEGPAGDAAPVKTVTTSTYTLIAGDAGKYIRFTNAAGCDIAVNPDVMTAEDEVVLRGTLDQLTLSPGSGMTINTPETLNSRKAHSTIALYFVTATEADLTGDMELS